MKPIQGIHHITSFASDPQRNVDFYHRLLGQRLVKTTVNFDDPATYHLYYGDEVGTPGTIMTYFPWPSARRGRVGNGEAGAVAYTIRPDSLPYWQDRLASAGITTGETSQRFGGTVLSFQDPDGMLIELITDDAPATIQPWLNGPVPADQIIQRLPQHDAERPQRGSYRQPCYRSEFGFTPGRARRQPLPASRRRRRYRSIH